MTVPEALTAVTAVLAGLTAGALLPFSSFVMAALGRVPAASGARVMQEINRTALTPVLLLPLLGGGVLGGVVSGLALADGDPLRALGGLGPLACLLLTVGWHVPRNRALDALDPEDPGTAPAWERYRRTWTRANHVRTLAAGIGCALLVLALV